MADQEQILVEALQKTVQVIETIEDRYREVAFPIILQSLLSFYSHKQAPKEMNQEENGFQTLEPRLSPALSVNEFFRRVNPDSHPARFVTAAYYLLNTGQTEQFSNADILEIYRKLRQPQPKNPTDVMNQCIRKAYIIDAPNNGDKLKQWVITPAGEKYVESLLNDNTNGNNTGAR